MGKTQTPIELDDQQTAITICVINYAKEGDRVILQLPDTPKPKTLWGGLGNRSGLHSYANTLISEKWEKSGERFTKRLEKIVAECQGEIQIQQFRNINRDRGRWVTIKKMSL